MIPSIIFEEVVLFVLSMITLQSIVLRKWRLRIFVSFRFKYGVLWVKQNDEKQNKVEIASSPCLNHRPTKPRPTQMHEAEHSIHPLWLILMIIKACKAD